MSPALEADGLRPTMSRVAVGAALRGPHGHEGIVPLPSAELCGSGGSAVNLLHCAEDHRRGTLDWSADQVPGAVAVMDLGEPPLDRDEFAVRAGCRPLQFATV